MKHILLFITLLFCASALHAEECLRVETSIDNRYFLINGIEFAAKTMCPNFEVGDEVVFIDGNPDGSSSDAIIVDMRSNETCTFWSQNPL